VAFAIPSDKFEDVIVAVHGIGEQTRYSTVRSVATRLATSKRMLSDASARLPVAPQPLGYFHSEVKGMTSVVRLDDAGRLTRKLAHIGFAEVFWADIPGQVVREGGTLEETKAWGHTVVARAQALWIEHSSLVERGAKSGRPAAAKINPDFSLAAEVLDEIIETVYVLENLLFLADKAGLFKFDLRVVLEAYLGDVQLVTEFANYRTEIVARFHKAMHDVYERQREEGNADVQLHIIAHSEGTVVSFLGLLQAMSGIQLEQAGTAQHPEFRLVRTNQIPEWLRHVRGYMTIGSPIDKHLLLWPRMWERLVACDEARQLPHGQIKWRNYYDYGDPIGFKLDTARHWVQKYWTAFEFRDSDDIGFARYLLPGKAHNDYWNDPEVFEHFIDSVVMPETVQAGAEAGNPPQANGKPAAADKPKTRPAIYLIGPSIPYVMSAVLLLSGVYVLGKAVSHFTTLATDPLMLFFLNRELGVEATSVSAADFFRSILGITALLAGTTLFARLPRLAVGLRWRVIGWASFIAGALLYLVSPAQSRIDNGAFFIGRLNVGSPLAEATIGVIILALLVALIGRAAARRAKASEERQQRWFLKRMRPLIFCGAVAIAASVVTQLFPARFGLTVLTQEQIDTIRAREKAGGGTAEEVEARAMRTVEMIEAAGFDRQEVAQLLAKDKDRMTHSARLERVQPLLGRPPAWPVILAGVAFLYLWWLATLVFDLGFVWQRYIRGSVAHDRLEHWGAHKLGGREDRRSPERPRAVASEE
jgi:hypothetical protein